MKISKSIFLFLAALLSASVCYGAVDLRMETWAGNLKNDNPLIRKSSARYLGQLGDKRAIPYLLQALKDPQAEVRLKSAIHLGFWAMRP
jgi:HEAT repeat protein